MRKILSPCLLVLLAGCHKTATFIAPIESAHQQQVKIIKTVTAANNSVQPLYSDTAYFNYNCSAQSSC